MPDPTHTTPDQSMPEVPEGVTRWYPQNGMCLTPERDADGTAVSSCYIARRDLPALYAAHRKQVEAETRALKEAAEDVYTLLGNPKLSNGFVREEGRKKLAAALDTLEAERG